MLVRAHGHAESTRHPVVGARRVRDRIAGAVAAVLLGAGLALVATSAAQAAAGGESPRDVEGPARANAAITSMRDEGELAMPATESPVFAIAGGLVGLTASAILVLAVRRSSPR
jgi:nucleoid-associated protein YgaU